MKISVYIATSLDGFIARPNGDIDWLEVDAPPGEDYGYAAFTSTVDVMLMGRKTFEKCLTFDEWPYKEKRVVVMSRSHVEIPARLSNYNIEISDLTPEAIVKNLADKGMKHAYLDGGALIQAFLSAGLVDDLIITTIPVLIGKGRPLFGPLKNDIKLKHIETKTFQNGLVQSHYLILKTQE